MEKQNLADWCRIIIPEHNEIFKNNFLKCKLESESRDYLCGLSDSDLIGIYELLGIKISSSCDKNSIINILIDYKLKTKINNNNK